MKDYKSTWIEQFKNEYLEQKRIYPLSASTVLDLSKKYLDKGMPINELLDVLSELKTSDYFIKRDLDIKKINWEYREIEKSGFESSEYESGLRNLAKKYGHEYISNNKELRESRESFDLFLKSMNFGNYSDTKESVDLFKLNYINQETNSKENIAPNDIEIAFGLDKGTILKYEKSKLTCSEEVNIENIVRMMNDCLKNNKKSGIMLDNFFSKDIIKIVIGDSGFDLFVKEQCNKDISKKMEKKNESQNFSFSLFNNEVENKDSEEKIELDSKKSLEISTKDIESAFDLNKGEVLKYDGYYITFNTESDLKKLKNTITTFLMEKTKEKITFTLAYGRKNTIKISDKEAFKRCIIDILSVEKNENDEKKVDENKNLSF